MELSGNTISIGKIRPNPDNPRIIKDEKFKKLCKSLKDFPEMMAKRPIVVDENWVILGGNMRWRALKENGMKTIPVEWVSIAEGWTEDQKREFVVKDNAGFGEWRWDALANWDVPLEDWGVDVPEWGGKAGISAEADEDERAEIERKKKEFEERIKAGEISEEDEEYQEFLEKFKLKKTTDDCYTPPIVYDAVADWVSNKYGISKAKFVRPFYPGGDYQNEKYPAGCVVVDNPPFSIMAKIVRFYQSKDIRFFLFGPHLTLFSSSSATAICTGVAITYENGANVNTSFLTNLEPGIRFKSEPSLYAAIKAANDENLKQARKQLPKYAYDHHVITTPFLASLSRLGIEFECSNFESYKINALDSQKGSGKSIFGEGYLISERKFAEREKAEREKAERWELSDREREIIAKLK